MNCFVESEEHDHERDRVAVFSKVRHRGLRFRTTYSTHDPNTLSSAATTLQGWDDDFCIWQSEVGRTALKNRSTSTRGCHRLAVLHQIEKYADAADVSLADLSVKSLWDSYLKTETANPMLIKDHTVDRLSKILKCDCESLKTTLMQIRDTKHYLHFAGIHSSVSEGAVGNEVICEKPANHGREYSIEEMQLVYDRLLKETKSTTFWSDLAAQLERSEQSVARKRHDLTEMLRAAEAAVEESVSLVLGPDTDLWNQYTQSFVHQRGLAKRVPIVTTHVNKVAEKHNLHGSVVQTRLRIVMIRTLKEFLHIAGVHDDREGSYVDPISSDDDSCSFSSTTSDTIEMIEDDYSV